MNTVNLIGYMHKLKFEYSNEGKPRCSFRLRVPNGKRDGEYISFFVGVKIFGEHGVYVGNNGADRRRVAVNGQLNIWTTGDGKEVPEITFAHVEFLDKQADAPQTNSMGSEPAFTDDDDVPF